MQAFEQMWLKPAIKMKMHAIHIKCVYIYAMLSQKGGCIIIYDTTLVDKREKRQMVVIMCLREKCLDTLCL